MNSEIFRYQNTLKDLLDLKVNNYCELGPGQGEISIALKEQGKTVCAMEAPWEFESRTAWSAPHGIRVYKGEFFTSDFSQVISEPVQCFSLIHCIAHFRFPPHILFKQILNKLDSGGLFYLSTVNGGSLDRIIKLVRGAAITEEVKEYQDMGEEYRLYCNPSGRYMIWDSWMHVKEYRVQELVKMLKDCGFKIKSTKHRNNFRHWKTELACKIWPHMAEEIVVVAQKP